MQLYRSDGRPVADKPGIIQMRCDSLISGCGAGAIAADYGTGSSSKPRGTHHHGLAAVVQPAERASETADRIDPECLGGYRWWRRPKAAHGGGQIAALSPRMDEPRVERSDDSRET